MLHPFYEANTIGSFVFVFMCVCIILFDIQVIHYLYTSRYNVAVALIVIHLDHIGHLIVYAFGCYINICNFMDITVHLYTLNLREAISFTKL